jgi:hypothetical protein
LRLAQLEAGSSRHAPALDALARAWEKSGPKFKDAGFLCELYSLRSQIHVALGLIDLAHADLENADRAARALPPDQADPKTLASVSRDRAYLANALQDWSGMLAILTDAELELARVAGNEMLAQHLFLRGLARSEHARRERTDPDTGREDLEAALALEGALAWTIGLHAEVALADMERRSGRLEAARARTTRAAELFRSHADATSNVPRLRLALAQARLASTSSPSREELESCRAELTVAVQRACQDESRLPRRRGGVGFLFYWESREPLSLLARLETALGTGSAGTERALASIFEAHAQGSLARRANVQAVDVATVRETLLGDGNGLIVLMPGLESSSVFFVDAHDAFHEEIASRDVLVAAIEALRAEIATDPRTLEPRESERRARALESHAKTVSDLLFSPRARSRIAGWRGFYFVGAELAADLPVEVLCIGEKEPLGSTRAIAYASSVPYAVHLATRAKETTRRAERDWCLFAAPEGKFVLDDAEIDALSRPFAGERSRMYVREQATAASFRSTPLNAASVLTILAHGVVDAARARDEERPGGFELSDDAIWCQDVEQSKAPPLVELLVCGGLRGHARLGDDLGTHVASAFFAGGTACIVASRADIPYRSTVELAARAHVALREDGVPPAEAYRRARAALRADPATADPWFWSLLTVNGLGFEPVFEAERSPRDGGARMAIASGAALLAVLVAIVALRARRA